MQPALDFEPQLRRIAGEMDSARALPTATVGYDALADGLVWSDEYPPSLPGRSAEFDCVRILLRFRTSLILGEPEELCRRYWELGKEIFPHWAGFEPDRVKPSVALLSRYERLKRQSMKLIDRLMRHGDQPRP